MNIVLNGGIGGSQELSIQIHEWNVKEKAVWMKFTIHIEGKGWVQIFLWDSKNQLRLQYIHGRCPNTLILHESAEKSSSLTLPGSLPEGKWKLEIHTICKENLEYQIEIDYGTEDRIFEDKIQYIGENIWAEIDEENRLVLNRVDWTKRKAEGKRWYKGDFHTHTNLSDGKLTLKEVMTQAEKMGLDFFVVTDHNVLPTGWVEGGALVIPGVEITSSKGHFNALGLRKWLDWRVNCEDGGLSTEEGMNRLLKEAKEAGALRSIDHPVLAPWEWLFRDTLLREIDTIEICNDPTFPDNKQATEKALELWNALWNDGYQIWGIGGSDSHLYPTETYEKASEPSLIGDPATYVLADGLSAKEILEGVAQGRIYVSRGPVLEVEIFIDEKAYELGSNLTDLFKEEIVRNIEYRVKISNMKEKGILKWIENGEVISSTIIKGEGVYSRWFTWRGNEYRWARIEIRREDESFLAFTNPIYKGKKAHTLLTWGELVEKIGG